METYFFVFDAEPSEHSPRAADVSAGKVNVFVHCAAPEQAEFIARSHVMDYGWLITNVEHARGPMPEHIPGLDQGLIALRRKAERYGVASEFIVWPKEERPEDHPIEVRPMGPPILDGKKKKQ